MKGGDDITASTKVNQLMTAKEKERRFNPLSDSTGACKSATRNTLLAAMWKVADVKSEQHEIDPKQ